MANDNPESGGCGCGGSCDDCDCGCGDDCCADDSSKKS